MEHREREQDRGERVEAASAAELRERVLLPARVERVLPGVREVHPAVHDGGVVREGGGRGGQADQAGPEEAAGDHGGLPGAGLPERRGHGGQLPEQRKHLSS